MSIWSSLFTGQSTPNPADRTIIIGTPRSIRQVRRTVRQAEQPVRPVGCVLLHAGHRNGAIGLPVLGTVEQLAMIIRVHRIGRALVSLPAAMGRAASRIEAICEELGVQARHMPTLEDQLAGRVSHPGSIDPAKLLDRPAHQLDHDRIRRALAGKRVLITGAGGSIGSHLAMLVAQYEPAQLLLMERSENNLFEIDRRIKTDFPVLDRVALLHDVTDESGTLGLAQCYQPQVIFHAAAHKHVPMMEDHPSAAVENNFFGTKAIADAAAATGAERFVMISTDKAVNPSSVMGATKRLAELYIQYLDGRTDTRFSMVRFGNVLGSACSVVPIWSDQLSRGGPLTVTDPRMTRYFMTIPEAASLVLQAACLDADAARVFVLDMGDPIRIIELAQRFIEAHGMEVGRDVEIVLTGIRPGEKLHEQLAYDSEDMQPTEHPAVRTVQSDPPGDSQMTTILQIFTQLRNGADRSQILSALNQALGNITPDQQPQPVIPTSSKSVAIRTA